jgi:high-affinity iron transporter
MPNDSTGARRSRAAGAAPRIAAAAAFALLAAVAGAVESGRGASADPAVPAAAAVALDEKACGTGWSAPHAGAQDIDLANDAKSSAEVFLINPSTNVVFAEIENLAPGVSRTVSANLAAGRYAFRCSFVDGTDLTSKTYTVTGRSADPTPGIVPVSDLDLQGPVSDYRGYVQQNLPVLLADSEKLDADLHAGNLASAKADWLTAHLDYERLGAAYDTFGDFDAAIDGTAGGLPGGVQSASWTGFYRIEYGLYHGQPTAVLAPLGDKLDSSVKGLISAFPGQSTLPTDIPLRAHEILENALQFQLTGLDDYGSGTTLACLQADIAGTEEVLSVVEPLMQPRDPQGLAAIRAWIATVQGDLKAAQGPDGTWTPVEQLTTAQRQKLDGDTGELLEQLSIVPDLLEERSSA